MSSINCMDLSPCRVLKMILHNRFETYLKIKSTDDQISDHSRERILLSPISVRKLRMKHTSKPKINVSYKPSSCLYQRLNAKITLNKLEFFKDRSSSPSNSLGNQNHLLQKNPRQQILFPLNLRSKERKISEVLKKT